MAIVCSGGLVFALIPNAALLFMGVVGLWLACDLVPLVGEPHFYVAGIVLLVGVLATMFLDQAELFAARARAATDLRLLELRRSDEAARAAEARQQMMLDEQQRRETDRSTAEAARRVAMAAHAQHFETNVLAVIDRLGEVVAELGASTGRLTNAGKATRARAAAIRERAVTVGVSMGAVRFATDEMRGAIREIGREVAGQVEATATTVDSARRARDHANALAKRSRAVGNIVETIDTIAAKTNVLALNALIEAARSGEAGRGFAVVAEEVKALALQTQRAAREIGEHIADMDLCAVDVADSITAINDDMARIGSGATDIAAAVRQQERATRDIGESVDRASADAQNVEVDLQDMARQAEIAVELAGLLTGLTAAVSAQSAGLSTASSDFGRHLRAS